MGGGSGAFGGGASGVFGGGARLSSFAGPIGDAKVGSSKPEKPFGAPAGSDEDSEPDSESAGEPAGDDAASKEQKDEEALSPKFHVQEGEHSSTRLQWRLTTFSPNWRRQRRLGF